MRRRVRRYSDVADFQESKASTKARFAKRYLRHDLSAREPGAAARRKYRLLRSITSSRRTGTTEGSTSGQMLGMSGSTPVCGTSIVVNTVCNRSRLRDSSAAPVYLVAAGQGQRHVSAQNTSAERYALKIQLQVGSRELERCDGLRTRAP